MKKASLILGLLSIMTLCLTACGKPNVLTFEDAVDSIWYSEVKEMMDSAENYEQKFRLSSNYSGNDSKVQSRFSVNTKHNKKDAEWESSVALSVDISWIWDMWVENASLDWNAVIRYIPNGIYFKLNALNISGLEDTTDDVKSQLSWVINKWFSFELTDEMLEAIQNDPSEEFDYSVIYNEKDFQKFKNDLKKSINNDGAVVYSGIYSEFKWCNAWKFSINKDKVAKAIKDYIQVLRSKANIQDWEDDPFDEMDIDEMFKDLPFKNFKWYLVVTKKGMVQVVVENLDIESENSLSKVNIHGTFGDEKYHLVVKQDNKVTFLFSAKLQKDYYNIALKVNNAEILRWTATIKQSKWKFSVLFDLSVNIELDEKISIPLNGWWSWKKVSKFNVKAPANSKNLLEDIMEDMDGELDVSSYKFIAWGMKNQSFTVPIVAGGIMVAALMPRMQSAQSRARDVARKSDLSQIQTAIVTSQSDKWQWPGINTGADKWIPVSSIENELISAGMYSVPSDPNYNNYNYWLWENYKNKWAIWEYLYLVTKRNWVKNGGFVLMAKSEVEWWSNWVVCKNGSWLSKWYINNDTDLANVHKCMNIIKWDICSNNEWTCSYTNKDELRYILMY